MVTRRDFLNNTAAAAVAFSLPVRTVAQATLQTNLTVATRILEVKGRAATVMGITDGLGKTGLILSENEPFDLRVTNTLNEPTVIHWHGLTPPFQYDGSNVSQDPIQSGGTHDYRFDLTRGGTNWMHSHFGLQEASLLAAPLIVQSADDLAADRQDVTIILHDFSFTPPTEILAGLQSGAMSHVGSGMAAMSMGMVRTGQGSMAGMDHSGMDMSGQMNMDLNDITFDAFLANDRDLSDPEIVQVDGNSAVRLRVINAASSSNFWIDLGQLSGRLIAVDGMNVAPIFGSRFEIAMAQRLDIDVNIPAGGGAFPVLAQLEGGKARTGVIMASVSAAIAQIPSEAELIAPPVLLDLERQLLGLEGLASQAADLSVALELTGDMSSYQWGINGRTFSEREPVQVALGQRVEITLRNQTMMSHPMHLHGHHFQVVGLGRARLNGAMRDTVLIPAMESVTIAFDADNPGEWPLHCHNMYHMAAGMMTTVKYS